MPTGHESVTLKLTNTGAFMDVKKWACLDVDISIAVEIVDAVEAHINNFDRMYSQALYSATTELVANIKEHAYPENFKSEQDLACEITISEATDGTLTISVADYGVTIPQSILNKFSKEHALTIDAQLPSDAEIIANAVIPKSSSTKESGRGRGLNSIFDFVSKGSLQSIKISSRHGSLYCTNKTNELSINSPPKTGTLIEITLPTGSSSIELLKHGEINIAKDFSKTPAGRSSKEGEYSAESFINNFLLPAFEKHQTVTVNLDDTYGYGASFLDESFAGLVRNGHSASSLKGRLNLISNDDFHLTHQIWTYIEQADKK